MPTWLCFTFRTGWFFSRMSFARILEASVSSLLLEPMLNSDSCLYRSGSWLVFRHNAKDLNITHIWAQTNDKFIPLFVGLWFLWHKASLRISQTSLEICGTGDYSCPGTVGPRSPKRLGDSLFFQIQFTFQKINHFKCTISWLLIYSQGCTTITTRPSDSELSKYIYLRENQNFSLISIYL